MPMLPPINREGTPLWFSRNIPQEPRKSNNLVENRKYRDILGLVTATSNPACWHAPCKQKVEGERTMFSRFFDLTHERRRRILILMLLMFAALC